MKRRTKWSNSVRKNVSYVLRKMAYGFVLFLIPCPQIPSASQILIKICNFLKKKKNRGEKKKCVQRRGQHHDNPFPVLHSSSCQ